MSELESIKRELSVLEQLLVDHALGGKEHPNIVGEVLREWAFLDEFGCYSCFDIRKEFEVVKVTEREFKFLMGRSSTTDIDSAWGFADKEVFDYAQWYKHPNGIEMGWFWDGDGTLAFYVPELMDDCYNGIVYNSDCKKDYEWHFQMRSDIKD